MSRMNRSIFGESMSGMPASSSGPSAAACGSAMPLIMAKRLISLTSFLWPHFGQTGTRSGFTRLERKLKIFRHLGQANS
jgi:hypothetical protein